MRIGAVCAKSRHQLSEKEKENGKPRRLDAVSLKAQVHRTCSAEPNSTQLYCETAAAFANVHLVVFSGRNFPCYVQLSLPTTLGSVVSVPRSHSLSPSLFFSMSVYCSLVASLPFLHLHFRVTLGMWLVAATLTLLLWSYVSSTRLPSPLFFLSSLSLSNLSLLFFLLFFSPRAARHLPSCVLQTCFLSAALLSTSTCPYLLGQRGEHGATATCRCQLCGWRTQHTTDQLNNPHTALPYAGNNTPGRYHTRNSSERERESSSEK